MQRFTVNVGVFSSPYMSQVAVVSFVPSNKHPVVVLGAAGINGPRFCFCWVLRAALTEDGAYSRKYEIVLVECLKRRSTLRKGCSNLVLEFSAQCSLYSVWFPCLLRGIRNSLS